MTDNDDLDLAGRVRAIRKGRKWTQKQMAVEAGMSVRAYQNFETRKGEAQPENLRGILRAAGLDAEQPVSEDEQVAAETRASWPPVVAVFLDMLGAYLNSLPEGERLEAIHDLTRQVFIQRHID